MKYLLIFCAFLCIAFLSCTRNSDVGLPEDHGCIDRKIVPVTAHDIKPADIVIADNLFLANNLDNRNYRYYRYDQDSTQTQFPPFAKFDNKVVRIAQYCNGVRIFGGDLLFQFKNNLFNYMGGHITNGTSLNTAPRLTLGQLRKLFIDNLEKFDGVGSQYKDSCLYAEFGYCNINAGTSNAVELLVKCWRVTGRGSSLYVYPFAYYKDDDGKLIQYDNGVRTFR